MKRVLITVLSGLLLISCTPSSADKVCFKRDCFDVELAITESERRQGLMGREFLGADTGMLFVFADEDIHAFWMKNTLIPLDIIWLDRNRRVVHIEQDVQPCISQVCPQYAPLEEALYVLEFNAGFVDNYIIQRGDEVEIELSD